MTLRIVMLASADATADPRIAKEADALAGAGYEVVVLAWDRGGATAPVFQRNGWSIESLGPKARHGAGLRNVVGYYRYWRAAARRAEHLAPDVVHCHNLDTVPAALRVMKWMRIRPRLVLDFWEIYRESRALPQRGAVGRAARSAARLIERRSIPLADLVITVVEGQVYYYRDLGARNVVVVENAPDLDRYAQVDRESDDFVISFIGQKRWVPSLVTLMRAIQPHPEMRALLIGGGPAEAEVARIASGMQRVDVSGRVSPEEVPALYHRCHAVYACYDASLLNWRTSLPVKAMEAMACGLPVIVSKGTWMAEFVERNGLGLAVDDSDVADVERALAALAGDRAAAREMGRRGREIVERELNWDAAAGRLLHAYAHLDM